MPAGLPTRPSLACLLTPPAARRCLPPPQLWLAVWATAASMGFVVWGLDLLHAWGKRCAEAAAADPTAPRPPLLTAEQWRKQQQPVMTDYVYRSLLRMMRVGPGVGCGGGRRGRAGARRVGQWSCKCSWPPCTHLCLWAAPVPQAGIWLTKNNAAKLAVLAYAFLMLTLALLYSANTSERRMGWPGALLPVVHPPESCPDPTCFPTRSCRCADVQSLSLGDVRGCAEHCRHLGGQ